MFYYTIVTVVLTALASAVVHAAPTRLLDTATLLKNGQNAQELNVLFQTLKETAACTTGDKACLSGGVAACVDGKWATGQGACSASQKCFAVPSVREAGTLVTCTSEKSALSAINATGASGGIFGSAGGNSSAATPAEDDDSGDEYCLVDDEDCECEDDGDADGDDSSTTATPISASTNPKATATPATPERVTVTVVITQPTTLPPTIVTRTISPEKASKVLSSATKGGGSIIETPASSSAIITPTVTSTSAQQGSASAPTTIILTAAPNLTRAASLSAPSVTSTSEGYAYGY